MNPHVPAVLSLAASLITFVIGLWLGRQSAASRYQE